MLGCELVNVQKRVSLWWLVPLGARTYQIQRRSHLASEPSVTTTIGDELSRAIYWRLASEPSISIQLKNKVVNML